MSLTGCMKKAGSALSAQDKAAVLASARGHRASGMKAREAALKGVDELLAEARAQVVATFKDWSVSRRVVDTPAAPTAPAAKTGVTLTEAFKRWFGDSKVVDNDGKPLVVYHGTNQDIHTFRTKGGAIYLTASSDYAGKYATGASRGNIRTHEAQPGSNVMPVYASIKNPYITFKGSEAHFLTQARVDALIAEGYDGVLYSPTYDMPGVRPGDATKAVEIVVFSPKQIKSAIGNSGAFDPTNSDIRFAMPGTSITAKLPAPLQRTTSDIGTVLAGAVKGALNHLTFTEDIIARAKAAGVSAAEKYAEVRQRRLARVGERERAANKVLEPFKTLSQAQQVLANDFIYDSTRENKWGFNPSWLATAKIDQATAARFRALEPATQDFVRSVFQHGYNVMQDKQKLVRDNVGVELDGDIAKAKASGNTALAKKLQSTKDALLARFGTLFAISGQGPYAPLRRTGDWLVVAKSAEYRQAEEAGDSKAVGDLETDPDHYFVSFAESELAAARMARDLEADGFPAGNVVHRPKEAALEELYGGNGMMGAFLKIKTQLEGLSDASHSVAEKAQLIKLQRVVTTMYLNALAEGSARKAELRRKGIAGKIDMVNGFSHQAVADAQFMASIEFNPQILKAISAMRQQAKEGEGQADKMRLYNELMLRHVESSEAKENRLAERTVRLTSLWMLATSPAYMLTNLTQTFVLSLPYMSRQHGYTSSANAILKSYKDVGALLQGTGVTGQIDFDKVPADVRKAIKELVELGRIDIGLDSEMGSFKVEEKGAGSRAWNAVDNGLRLAIQKIESINRLSAAMASYRLELARTGNHEKAVAYAGRVVTQSHGDYSRANAPRVFNSGLGRVALQFRKFQLIQLTYIAKLLKDSVSGDDQWAARKALGFTLAHMGVLGGLVAMPGFAALGAIAAALGGDEGPDDAEELLRKKIGNQDVSDLLLRGGPAALGLDLSGKIGMGNIMSVLPFTTVDLSDRKSVQEIGYSLALGATGGLILRGSDAVRHMTTGDYYRGLESAMPSGLMNIMKAARFKTEGVTNTKGDLLQTKDETALLDTFYQALGFTPTTTSRRQSVQANAYDVGSYFKERQALLRNQYTGAVNSGRSPARIIEDWRDMQDAMRDRGMAPAALGALFRAPAEQRKREADTAGGVQFTRKNRQLVEEAAAD